MGKRRFSDALLEIAQLSAATTVAEFQDARQAPPIRSGRGSPKAPGDPTPMAQPVDNDAVDADDQHVNCTSGSESDAPKPSDDVIPVVTPR